ncbi:MAG TPA: hypothetical protein VN622_14475 [Clostridia bacterium]|nr:hypothetical protein [Clostridia bacterium]
MAQTSARELLSRGHADEALRILTDKAKIEPRNAEVFNLMNRLYYALEDWDNAARNGERAVSLQPASYENHLWLGRAYGEKADNASPFSAMGLARKSVDELYRALQLNPGDGQVRMDLAEFYVEAPGIVGGGRDKASRLADEVERTQPAVALWIRARVANKDKNLPEAERLFRKAADAGNDPAFIVELARFYKWNQRWAEMEKEIVRAMASPRRKPIDLFNAGELLSGSGRNLQGGIQIMRDYLAGGTVEEGPAFRAHALIGEMYSKLGDRERAIAEYNSALALASNYRFAREGLKRLGVSAQS